MDEKLTPDTPIYLADTLGETDLWYSLCKIVFVGGSFSDVGGHTPFEPAAARCAVLHGPRYANFEEAYQQFHDALAAIQVDNAAHLAGEVSRLLNDPDSVARLGAAAYPLYKGDTGALERLRKDLMNLVADHD